MKTLQEKTKHPVQLVKFPGAFIGVSRNLLVSIEADRTTAIGKSIHAYLSETSNMEDHVIHLLFSANRWEAMYIAFAGLYLVTVVGND